MSNAPGIIVHRWFQTYEAAELACDYWAGDNQLPARVIEDVTRGAQGRPPMFAVETGMQALPDDYVEQYRNDPSTFADA